MASGANNCLLRWIFTFNRGNWNEFFTVAAPSQSILPLHSEILENVSFLNSLHVYLTYISFVKVLAKGSVLAKNLRLNIGITKQLQQQQLTIITQGPGKLTQTLTQLTIFYDRCQN